MKWGVIQGDCVERMRELPDVSVDAVVCDPPYGLEFMGREWDRLTYAGGNPLMKTGDRPITERDGESWQPGSAYGARQKNPRCRNCGKLQRGNGSCKCPAPEWDTRQSEGGFQMQVWHEAWAREALRVLKPGGHLLAFGGTRTYHRLAAGIEDAGFEIRDTICWLYGSGFPKSLDVSKAIDKAAGAERKVVGRRPDADKLSFGGKHAGWDRPWMQDDEALDRVRSVTIPATPGAEQWEGWGTALKPAHEPIVVARKPLAGTVAGNVLAHGTGALNIDGCRIGTDEALGRKQTPTMGGAFRFHGFSTRAGLEAAAALGGKCPDGRDARAVLERMDRQVTPEPPVGRWPANVVLDEAAAQKLDEQVGDRPSAKSYERSVDGESMFWKRPMGAGAVNGYGDSGGPSRFFAMFSHKEESEWVPSRSHGPSANAGTGGAMEPPAPVPFGETETLERFRYVAKASSSERSAGLPDGQCSTHPTVKPIELMRWLIRLVTPPGGRILDPFLGSGTTGCAAMLEPCVGEFIGIERDSEYVRIAGARIRWWAEHPEGVELTRRLEAERGHQQMVDAGQSSLFDEAA